MSNLNEKISKQQANPSYGTFYRILINTLQNVKAIKEHYPFSQFIHIYIYIYKEAIIDWRQLSRLVTNIMWGPELDLRT